MPATILVVDDSPTIRKVVVTLLEARGYRTLAATDGRHALSVLREPEAHVDMILLDFVMPQMNGYQFCRELRSDPLLRHLPVVLMSAKGDKIRGQFVQQTGAVDAITKPFDPRALQAVIESALRKPIREAGQPPQTRTADDEDAFDLEPLAAMDDTAREAEIANLFAKGLARLLAPTLARVGPNPDARVLTDVLRRALEPAQLRGLGGLLVLLDARKDRTAVLAGDLSFISIAEVLQLLELQRQTGVLKINFGDQEIALYLGSGKIDLIKSTNLALSFRLGRFLVEDTVLGRDALLHFLEGPDVDKRLLGEELISQGLASEAQIKTALKRQTSELVYEAVRWKSGRFTFRVGESCAEATLAHLGLAPGGLMMEGFRRVDEWQLIEGSFRFDDILVPDPVAIDRVRDRSELTAQEELVLAAVDSKRNVRQIVDDVDASTFDVCKVLYQFINSGLVRRKTS
jgi:CheY-like chemotaxis protein